MADPAKEFDPTTDSWAPGEPIPKGMPAADGGAPASGGNNLDAMVAPPKDLQNQLTRLATQKATASDDIYKKMAHTTDEDSTRLREAYKNEGIKPGEFQKWDADAEAAKRRTDPIEAFASFGSVFGILASAFTHAPMENALNASAAAMNSIKAGDQKSYEEAFKAREFNTKMALERHQLEHQAFQDASTLMHTNMESGMNMAKLNAIRFDDKKSQYLIEHGMIKEWFDYKESMQKAALAVAENEPKLALAHAERGKMDSLGFDWKHPASEKSQEALEKYLRWKAEMQALEKAADPHLKETERHNKAIEGIQTQRGDVSVSRQEEIERHNQAMEDIQAGRGDTSTLRAKETERHNKAMEGLGEKRVEGSGGAANLTTNRQLAQDVAAYRKKLRAEETDEGEPRWTAEEIAHKAAAFEKQLKAESTPITANQKDKLVGMRNQVKLAKGVVTDIEKLLKKHNAITGLGGSLTRPIEVISNELGSNATDRKEFQRLVSTMQEMAPRILLGTNARPISAEAGRVNNIIAGLAPGDTGPNSVRAYQEWRKILDQIEGGLSERIEGGASGEPTKGRTGGASDKWWTAPSAGRPVEQ